MRPAQGATGPARPRTRTAQMTAAQKAKEAAADEGTQPMEAFGQGQHGLSAEESARHVTSEFILGNEDPSLEQAHAESEEAQRGEEEQPQPGSLSQRPGPQRAAGQRPGQKPDAGAQQQLARALRNPGRGDGFEGTQRTGSNAVYGSQPVTGSLSAFPAPRPPAFGEAMAALHQAQRRGVFFREEPRDGRPDDSREDPELAAAVEECIRLLFGVPGILRVGPGLNDAGQPVILVVASRGFTAASMAAVPQRVHRFDTLLALPFELLPLRRERGA
jgi:hypothetical protein